MIKNQEKVFENAEDTAAKYQERIAAERKAREEAAQDVIFGLESVFTEPAAEGGDAAPEMKLEESPAADKPAAMKKLAKRPHGALGQTW